MAAYSSFIPKSMGKEKNSHSAVDKPEKYTLLQASSQGPHRQRSHSDSVQWEWCFISMVFFAKTHNPSAIMRSTSDQALVWYILPNTWPLLLNTVKVTKNKKSLKSYHNLEEAKGDMTTKCPIVSWMGPESRKWTQGKAGNSSKVWTSVWDDVSICIH